MTFSTLTPCVRGVFGLRKFEKITVFSPCSEDEQNRHQWCRFY
jgi:hypothetical protein